MEAIAHALNLQQAEFAILISMFISIPVTIYFHKLPLRKDTEFYHRDLLIRELYGAAIGLIYMWLIYSIKEVILLLIMGIIFYYMSI